MANTYSITNILGELVYDNETIINVFNKIDLSNYTDNLNYYDLYEVTNNDRWDLISTRFYGTPSLWWIIASFNGVKDPFTLPDLDKIKIIKREFIPTLMMKLKGYL